MEKITIVGNLGKDPVFSIKNYPDALCFSVGVAQGKKEENKAAVWYDVVSWNKEKSEELVLKLKKGSRVELTGKPTLRVWNDAEGVSKGQISINLSDLEVIESDYSKSDSGTVVRSGTKELTKISTFTDDDIPF